MKRPDGWMLVHHRAAGSSSQYFGPFKTLGEARKWWREIGRDKGVNGGLIPLYKTVDWNRR